MDDADLLRYSRQIMLPEIGIDGQQQLLRARIAIIGLGGLGSPVAMYLAAAGVGELVLVDDDRVDLGNLQRQIAHTTGSIGTLKTESAEARIHALNPGTHTVQIPRRLSDEELVEQARLADVVVDGTDNFDARFSINRACVAAGTPLVSGAVVRYEGQVTVFRPDQADGGCYRCLYEETDEPPPVCSSWGVLAPVAGIIGALQATEALKLILGLGAPLTSRLLVLDALTMEFREIRLKRDPQCPVCSARKDRAPAHQ